MEGAGGRVYSTDSDLPTIQCTAFVACDGVVAALPDV